jgi:hypothetical protein
MRTRKEPGETTMTTRRRRTLCAVLGTLTFLFCTLYVQSVQVQRLRVKAEANRPYGRYTPQQIVRRTQALCRALDPRADSLSYTPIRQALDDQPPIWSVEGSDASGNCVMNFLWDANTGQLRVFGRQLPRSDVVRSPLKTRHAAEHNAWQWLCTLGIAAERPHWRLTSLRLKSGGNWATKWQAEDRVANIIVNENGELLLASAW